VLGCSVLSMVMEGMKEFIWVVMLVWKSWGRLESFFNIFVVGGW
jgi:hypothetical protein